MTIEASAPGKLVIAGEYAVLVGAPALVAAVDRRATCTLDVAQQGGWRFESLGFESRATHTLDELFLENLAAGDPGRFVGLLARRRGLPEHAEVRLDSTSFFHNGEKLGIGSSAAVLVALAFALGEITSHRPTLDQLIAAHRAFQGGSGSGIDIAAAMQGGLIRFQDAEVIARNLDPTLVHSFIFTGESTSTSTMVQRFEKWRHGGMPTALRALAEAAARVPSATEHAAEFLERMRDYTEALRALDADAKIGIFGDAHRRAADLAAAHGVLYKPCGAGGADTGIALTNDADALRTFNAQATLERLVVLPMEITTHGVKVRTR